VLRNNGTLGEWHSSKERAIWEESYLQGAGSWQSGGVSPVVRGFLERHARGHGLLEIGCGSGEDLAGFVEAGFCVTGIDISARAVATAKAQSSRGPSTVLAADFFDWRPPQLYDVVYDKGVFHNLDSPVIRERFTKRVSQALGHNGLWVCVAGAADRPNKKLGHGAVFLSHVIEVVEKYFEVLEVQKALYGLFEKENDFEAWHCAFRRR